MEYSYHFDDIDIQNVLVTGGCGFIGSSFLNYMVHRYPNINFYNFDALNYCANLHNITVQNNPNYKFIYGKLQNKIFLIETIRNHKIDCVVHFAAQSHVDTSFSDSFAFTDDNIIATHILLECCRLCQQQGNNQIKRFIHISTDEVYGDSTIDKDVCTNNEIARKFDTCKNEHSHLNPTNPYAATKAAAEMLCTSYYYSFNLPIIITRSNNVYGPGQYKEKLIPKFINFLLNDQKCTIHGNGNFLRSFIHVHDVCKALELIMSSGNIGETYNIGSDDEYSVNQIADTLINIIKPSSTGALHNWKQFIENRVFNDTRYLISSAKLRALGWSPTIPFIGHGITSTIEWYKKKWLLQHTTR
jgi:dTDP-glucose 4,6-dehydratase